MTLHRIPILRRQFHQILVQAGAIAFMLFLAVWAVTQLGIANHDVVYALGCGLLLSFANLYSLGQGGLCFMSEPPLVARGLLFVIGGFALVVLGGYAIVRTWPDGIFGLAGAFLLPMLLGIWIAMSDNSVAR